MNKVTEAVVVLVAFVGGDAAAETGDWSILCAPEMMYISERVED